MVIPAACYGTLYMTTQIVASLRSLESGEAPAEPRRADIHGAHRCDDGSAGASPYRSKNLLGRNTFCRHV